MNLFPSASGQTVRFPRSEVEFQIQDAVNGVVRAPRWPGGEALPASGVAEVQRVIDGAEKDDALGVVYLRRLPAPLR